MTPEKRIAAARKLGREARKRGAKCIAALDKDLRPLVAGLPVGGGGLEIIDAWINGWTLEHRECVNAQQEDA
jgi:hypothetical protein